MLVSARRFRSFTCFYRRNTRNTLAFLMQIRNQKKSFFQRFVLAGRWQKVLRKKPLLRCWHMPKRRLDRHACYSKMANPRFDPAW